MTRTYTLFPYTTRFGSGAGAAEFISLRDYGKPALIFSAHLGNWELLPLAAGRYGLPLSVVFRPPNNPHAAELVTRIRAEAHGREGGLLPSGVEGAMAAVGALERGEHLGMLVDQRFRRGVLRSEEHTSELQSLMRISYAVLCLKNN